MSQMRLSGLISGMDTESIISQLVSVKSQNVKKIVSSQTKLSWKQEIWKDLNTQIKKLVNGTLDNLRYSSAYSKKMTDSSDNSKVTVSTADNAMNTTQSLKINKMAESGYLTGAKLGNDVTSGSKLTSALGITAGSTISVEVNGKSKDITITDNMTINAFVSRLQEAGVEANFDATNHRLFVGAKKSGESGDFNLTFKSADGQDALSKLGLLTYDDTSKKDLQKQIDNIKANNDSLIEKMNKAAEDFQTKYGIDLTDATTRANRKADLEAIAEEDLDDDQKAELEAINSYEADIAAKEDNEKNITELNKKLASWDEAAKDKNGAVRIYGKDAEIELNGATFTSSKNVFSVNGLTLTLKGLTASDETITLTTRQDTSGIYDTIKGFIKEYSELINKMDKLYNADSAKKYDVLTDEEKDAMSDTEVEKWETTIKDSLLRRDSTINTATSAMKDIMASAFKVNGKSMYLSSFGIETLNYFSAADNEKNAYHIKGDEDEDLVKNETNVLKNMIEKEPDTVVSFFTQLANTLYTKMNSLMASSDSSSYGTLYDDKKMKSEYDDYKTKLTKAEEKLADYEDKWYKKFAAMEKAMAKMQSQSNSLAGIMGGGQQ